MRSDQTQASPDLNVLRRNFRDAFESYTAEGRKMAELLIELEQSSQGERLHALNAQQERLNQAQGRYEEARQAYVTYVLSGLEAPVIPGLTCL